MSKLLVVFGATGQQGGSVVSHVLKDAELSKQYSLRAITREPSSPKAQALKDKGVGVVKADLTDHASLHAAMQGAHTVFFLTSPVFGPDAKTQEFVQGKATADAAVAEKVQYLIFSTLPHVSTVSEGKYTKVAAFDVKAEIQEYIRTLPIKSAFFSPGSFMQNFLQPHMVPRPTGDGTYMIARPISPQTQLPLLDTAGDTGKFVGAILSSPDKYEGQVFCAATALYSLTEMAETISKVSGKTVKYQQITEDDFRKAMSNSPFADELIEMMLFQQEYGYYGPKTKELVEWAGENATGKLKGFEEWSRENPLPLS